MRSGTTAIADYLRAHPAVFVPMAKELHFFDRNLHRGTVWYSSHFLNARPNAVVGEATPEYMYGPDNPRRMSELLPEARLVAILRNPTDRAYSHYCKNRSNAREELSFEEALEAEPARLSAGTERDRYMYSYVDRGRYLQQLRHVLAFYPRDQLHIIVLDDLRDRPGDIYRALCRFLEISEDVRPALVAKQINRSKQIRSARLRQWYGDHWLPRPVKTLLGALNTTSRTYPRMRDSTRQWLLGQFDQTNADLETFLKRDLSIWSR
jgi:hypothetical protein